MAWWVGKIWSCSGCPQWAAGIIVDFTCLSWDWDVSSGSLSNVKPLSVTPRWFVSFVLVIGVHLMFGSMDCALIFPAKTHQQPLPGTSLGPRPRSSTQSPPVPGAWSKPGIASSRPTATQVMQRGGSAQNRRWGGKVGRLRQNNFSIKPRYT